MGRVIEMWRFPVKSMQGETLGETELTRSGLAGDRRYGLLHAETGKVLSAKRHGELLMASARTEDDGTVVIRLPGGDEHAAADTDIDDVISSWLGLPCHLAVPKPDEGSEFEMSFNFEAPDTDVFSWPCAPGTFLDLASAHLLTTSSLTTAATLHADGDWDVRRFRPTALIDTGDAIGFVEDGWVGTTLQLGGATLSVDMPTIRCPMPTRAQPGGLCRDLAIARALRDHHDNNLGVYATVTTSGRVAVGDELFA